MHTKSTVLLVGRGRLAKHLNYWNQSVQTSNQILIWDRTQQTDLLKNCIQQCSLVWLAISDSSLTDFYTEYLKDSGKTVVHFSGAFSHPEMISAHPLMSFSHDLFEKSVYEKIHFALTGADSLETALPGFKNSFTKIAASEKALYHALCVLAGNFPQLLWNETLKEFRKLNIPDQAVDLYLKQIVNNFVNLKEQSITGPLVRKDLGTIEKNLQALEGKSSLQSIYKNFNDNFGGGAGHRLKG